ncbi:MAG: peptidoglycan-binding protein [Beijerinckiaceae bacterium]|nr:peptidoglycan-binding protein [Beijerinckiaceae bacterium]
MKKRSEKLRKSVLSDGIDVSRAKGRGSSTSQHPDNSGREAGAGQSSRWRLRPGRFIHVAICVVVTGGIGANALFFQSERHPAPFFAKNTAVPQKASAAAGKKQITPVQRTRVSSPQNQQRTFAQTSKDANVEVSSSALAGRSSVAELGTRTASADTAIVRQPGPARDLIGSLIRGNHSATPRPPGRIPLQRKGSESLDASKQFDFSNADRTRIAAMQKALVKLGYPLTVDGLAGPATQQALEKFQRKNRLPTTGRAEGKTLQVLASRARIAIP